VSATLASWPLAFSQVRVAPVTVFLTVIVYLTFDRALNWSLVCLLLSSIYESQDNLVDL
jgi:hypothetical protein